MHSQTYAGSRSKSYLDEQSKNRRTIKLNQTTKSVPQELIEQTRRLMEQTIVFVPNTAFKRTKFSQQIMKMRPETLDHLPEFEDRKPAVAFVSKLVQSPLLSSDEERYLFLWMNFLKFRAERNRRKLDLRNLSKPLVEQIVDDLNRAAEARDRIVTGNVRLIIAVAKKLAVSIDQMSDLIGEGMSPLIRSVELFDVGLGYRFSTYATWAVRNQMLRWLKRSRIQRELTSTESSPSLENFPDQRPIREFTENAPERRVAVVHRLMQSLSEKEQTVVAARFGLQNQPAGQSLSDISRQVGLSKERVRQIVLRAISKLRELISYDEFEKLG